MIASRPFQAGDLDGLHRPGDAIPQMSVLLVRHGSFVRTLTDDDGTVLAVFGLVMRWEGVADAWAVVGDAARGRGVSLTRKARALLRQFAAELGLRRVGIATQARIDEYCRWAELVGFGFEGVEERAAPDGGDIIRYRWFPNG